MSQSADRRIPSLDGLRALSIWFVLLAHLAGTRFFPVSTEVGNVWNFGDFGVRAFFVISGFLITGLLLREIAESGRVRLGASTSVERSGSSLRTTPICWPSRPRRALDSSSWHRTIAFTPRHTRQTTMPNGRGSWGIALVIDWCVTFADGRVGRVPNAPPLVFVGWISYSLYLWQQPFLIACRRQTWQSFRRISYWPCSARWRRTS